MAIKLVFFLFPFFSFSNSLTAQELDRKVFIIQSNDPEAEGRVIEPDYDNLGKKGAKVQLWDKKGTPRQAWKFVASGKGANRYYIINQSPKAGKSKYLEARWTTLGQDGGKVQLWEFNAASKLRYGGNQIWCVTKNNNGSYSIISAHPKSDGKALEADSFTKQKNGGKVQLYFNANTPNQAWNLIEKN